MQEPSLSVVVPCRNEADRLRACLRALRAQEFPAPRYELLVVDGASTDGCPQIARRHGARVFQDDGRGVGAARNLGIRHARGAIVAFTDADCVPRRDWLARIAEVFAEKPDIAGVAGSLRMPRATLLGRMEDDDAVLFYRGFITSNAAYRRDVLLAVGGFDQKLTCAEDYDLAWRILDAGYRIVHDPRPQVLHDPPELYGHVHDYLKKQVWYARNDVPGHLLAYRRMLHSPEAGAGSADAVAGGLSAIGNASLTAAAVGGLLKRSPSLVALGVAGALVVGGRRVVRAANELGVPPREVPARVAVNAAKALARGAGTLGGLLDLARPRTWRRISAREAVSLGPAPPRAAPAVRARA